MHNFYCFLCFLAQFLLSLLLQFCICWTNVYPCISIIYFYDISLQVLIYSFIISSFFYTFYFYSFSVCYVISIKCSYVFKCLSAFVFSIVYVSLSHIVIIIFFVVRFSPVVQSVCAFFLA